MTEVPDAKVSIVSGAANGMGLAVTLSLLERGDRVVAVDRDSEGLDRLAELAPSGRDNVLPIVADIGVESAASDIVSECLSWSGRVDALVNNAGLPKYVIGDGEWERLPLWRINVEDLEQYFATHVRGPFALCKSALEVMLPKQAGAIITVTTNLHTMVSEGAGVYGPTKAAAECMMAILSRELLSTGITVNVLNPGGRVATRPMAPGERRDQLLLSPAVLAPPLLWLISDSSLGFTGRRIDANRWDARLPGDVAAEAASSQIAW